MKHIFSFLIAKKNVTKMTFVHLLVLFTMIDGPSISQNMLAVPFTSGFIGDVTGNNSCNNTVYLSSLGCTGIYFAQNSNTTLFVTQGNDIVGSIVLTDANGVEHTIPGFVKWRAPSGTVTSLVFSPSGTTVLATSGGGTYTVTTSKYIGIIFNGQTIDVSTGIVTGNASSTGLLDVLNSYLSTFPSLTVPDYSINESVGALTVTVSLTEASANEIRVRYSSSDTVAVAGSDYTATSGQLIFAPNQTSITLTIYVLTDLLAEPSELFYLNLYNPVNASITNSTSNITILDNPPLSVELVRFNASCQADCTLIEWKTATEKNSDFFIIERKLQDENWKSIAQIKAAGQSSIDLDYVHKDTDPYVLDKYYRLIQVDVDGQSRVYDPVAVNCYSRALDMDVFPNPSTGTFQLLILDARKGNTAVKIYTLNGQTVFESDFSIDENDKLISFENETFSPGIYFVQVEHEGMTNRSKVVVE